MKRVLALSLLTSALPLTAFAGETLLPAGSLIQCTVSEPRLSSQTDKIGDPVLCQVSHAELYGRATVPYGSYLVGHFEDFKDPGHLVGKGWVELRFDRLVIGETNVPMQARVVAVPNTKYPVDSDGRIHGTGHAVRDTVEWFIPVLWPIDLINLPRRGPRVVLKPETRLTLKVMDDVGIPTVDDPGRRQPLVARSEPAPIEREYSYAPAPQQYVPQQSYSQPQAYAPQQNFGPTYTQPQYAPTPQTVIVNNYPPQQQQPVVVQAPPPQVIVRTPPPVVRYAYPPPYGYPAYPPARFYPGY